MVSGAQEVPFGQSYAVGDVIGVEVDVNKRTLHFFKNGADQGMVADNLPDVDFSAAVSLVDPGDSVTMLRGDGSTIMRNEASICSKMPAEEPVPRQ